MELSLQRLKFHRGLRQGVLDCSVIPVICGATLKNIGLHTTFDMVKDFLPSPSDNQKIQPEKNEFVCQIFKTTIDSFLGTSFLCQNLFWRNQAR